LAVQVSTSYQVEPWSNDLWIVTVATQVPDNEKLKYPVNEAEFDHIFSASILFVITRLDIL